MSENGKNLQFTKKMKQVLLSKRSIIIVIFSFLSILILVNSLFVSLNGLLGSLKYQIYKHDAGTSNVIYQNGIPYVDYGYKENEFIGVQISPTAMVREALDNLTIYYDENSTEALDFCFTIADWLLNNKLVMQGPHWENSTLLDYYMWSYNFSVSYPKKYIDGPWFSALAQGHIIDFFEQLYQITSNNTYRNAAVHSLNSLLIKIEDEGLLIIEGVDKFWLPEVAEIYKPDSRRYILGGFLHTIQNLANVQNITNSLEMADSIEELITKSVINLREKVELYSYKDEWTYYDRLGNPTATNYHIRNTELMGWLYNYTLDPLFYYYWDKWNSTPHEHYPKDFSWYFSTYFTETVKYWWFTLLISIGITVIALSPYYIVKFRKIT